MQKLSDEVKAKIFQAIADFRHAQKQTKPTKE
jgi:hypothetical protein